MSRQPEPRGNLMADKPMGKLIAHMSVPLMISMLIQSLYNIVDSIFVAKLGLAAISAVGVAFPIQMISIALGNGLSAGMNALIAQRFGRGERDETGRAALCTLVIAAVLSIAFIAFGIFGCEAYLRSCGVSAEIMTLGKEYLQVVSIGAFSILYLIVVERFLQVTGKASLSMVTQLSGAVINIILDPILIFGYFGAPALGVRGAALATVLGQTIALGIGFFLHHFKNPELRLDKKFAGTGQDVRPIVTVAIPISLTMAMGSVMVFGMNRLLAPFVAELAMFTIYFKLQSFFFMPVAGLAQGLAPIIGFNYGARNGERLRAAIRIGALVTLGITVFGLLLGQLAPAFIVGLFDDGSQSGLVPLGSRVLRILSWTFPVAGVAMVCSNVFQGMGTGRPALLYGIGRQLVFLFPAAFVFLHFFGVAQIWYAYWVAELLTGLLVFFVFKREYRKRVVPYLLSPEAGQTE